MSKDEPRQPPNQQGKVDAEGGSSATKPKSPILTRTTIEASWDAPFPPPSLMRGYDDVVPNGAERVFAQFEKEGDHRRKLEARAIVFELIDRLAGRVCALLFAFGALWVAYHAVSRDAQWAASVIGGGVIAATVYAFVSEASRRRGPTLPKQEEAPSQANRPNRKN